VKAAGLRNAILLAVGTLTAVPVRPPSQVSRATAGRAMLLAPLVALIPGAAAAGVLLAARLAGLDSLLGAALAVAALALVTRALHLDGLADTVDGLTAGYDAERALAVMRRGDVGPAGAVAICLVVLVQTLALAQACAGRWGPVCVVVAAVAGRSTLPFVCRRGVPAARPEGLGVLVAGSLSPAASAAGVALAAVIAAALGQLTGWPPAAHWRIAGWALAAVGVAVLTGWLVQRRAVRRLGGITGDVLGACVEAGTAAAALVLAAAR